MKQFDSVYSKAVQMGYPYIDTENGRVSKDGKTWLSHFVRKSDNTGLWIGWNGRNWVIEE